MTKTNSLSRIRMANSAMLEHFLSQTRTRSGAQQNTQAVAAKLCAAARIIFAR